MLLSWLVPTLAYVLALGVIGVASKLALRSLSWQELVLWAALLYTLLAAVLIVVGGTRISLGPNSGWAVVAAICIVSSLVLLFLALEVGSAGTVVPISAAYPAVTLVLAAILLSEEVSAGKLGGVLLVIAGVVLLTVSD